MTDDHRKNYLKSKNVLDYNIIKRRERNGNFRYFTPSARHKDRTPFRKIIRNATITKESSKLTERPNIRNSRTYKNDLFINNDNSLSMISNRIINFNNSYNYPINDKKVVLFTEPPKKLSDYILKNKSPQKIYKLIYLNEDDINYLMDEDDNMYNNYYSIRDYRQFLFNRRKPKSNINENDYNNYLFNKLHNHNNKSYNLNTYADKSFIDFYRKDNYICIGNDIFSNNQNNDQLKVVKIQSLWRGYQTRKFMLRILNKYYKMMKIINCLNRILYKHSKLNFKDFFNSISQKKNNIYTYNNINKNIARNKKIIPVSVSSISFRYGKKNKNKYQKENLNKPNIIDNNNNINICIPGKKKIYAPPPKNNLVVYRRKNNAIQKSPVFTKKKLDIKSKDKIILRAKTKGFEIYTKLNYKNKRNLGINKIKKFIIRKNALLYFPLLLYRLRILEKVNLIVFKYKHLLKVFKIKEKLGLYHYFHKYRKNILSQTVNQIFIKNKDILNQKEIINDNYANNNKNNLNDSNPKKENNIANKNNNELLKMLIIKKDITIKILSLKYYFNKWEKKTKIILDLKRNKNIKKNYLNKSTEMPRKKFIKIKRIKSNNFNDVTQPRNIGNGKGLTNSFDIDIIKKMKVSKLRLDKGLSQELNKNNEKEGNALFIQKVASIFKKIEDKDMKFQCFNYWKKKTKEIK
jgi:hypothetical protein